MCYDYFVKLSKLRFDKFNRMKKNAIHNDMCKVRRVTHIRFGSTVALPWLSLF